MMQQRAGGGQGGPPGDTPQVDTAEQVYISSLALLKMLKHGERLQPAQVVLSRNTAALHCIKLSAGLSAGCMSIRNRCTPHLLQAGRACPWRSWA